MCNVYTCNLMRVLAERSVNTKPLDMNVFFVITVKSKFIITNTDNRAQYRLFDRHIQTVIMSIVVICRICV